MATGSAGSVNPSGSSQTTANGNDPPPSKVEQRFAELTSAVRMH